MKKIMFVIAFTLCFNKFALAKVNVVTTTFILSSIVQQIGRQYVDSTYLIPTGANPHIFSPKPRSLLKLLKANLFVGIGYGFEFWLPSIREFLKNKNVLFLSTYYHSPIDSTMIDNKEIANPHIWLDLKFMGNIAVYKIANQLCKIDKNHCSYFQENARLLSNQIKKIRSLYIKTLHRYKKYCFLDIKPAFEYLLRSIGMHSCCVLIKKGNEEPTISNIKEAFINCKCKKGVILYISNMQLATMMAEKLHFSKAMLNPLGNKTYLNTYYKLMIYNLTQLNQALK